MVAGWSGSHYLDIVESVPTIAIDYPQRERGVGVEGGEAGGDRWRRK